MAHLTDEETEAHTEKVVGYGVLSQASAEVGL